MTVVKVLIVTQYFWPESFRINEIAESLKQAGCDVHILTGQPNYPEGVIRPGYSMLSARVDEYRGLPVYRVPLIPRGRGSGFRLAMNYLSFVVFAAILGPWFLRRKPLDAVLVYGISPILQAIPAIWIGWLKRAKVITWVQDQWPESLSATGFVRQKGALQAVQHVVRWIYHRNDLLLVQSRAFVPPVKHLAGPTPVEYHPNPGEIALSKPGRSEESPLQLLPGFNVVFAGNLGTVQALGTILEAAELLRDMPDVRFVLVGSGSRGEWLASEVKRRRLENVQLAGRFPSSAMPRIMSQASALLVTLVRSPIMAQTIPSKVQAYLAAGRPILAALDGEGAAVVCDAKAGIACEAEDSGELADAVRRLHRMSEAERTQMGAAGRAYYERHFDPEVLAQQLKTRIERLVRDSTEMASCQGHGAKDCGK